MNAREVSDLSREEAGWRLTDEGETIPYAAAALVPREQHSRAELSPRPQRWLRSTASQVLPDAMPTFDVEVSASVDERLASQCRYVGVGDGDGSLRKNVSAWRARRRVAQ